MKLYSAGGFDTTMDGDFSPQHHLDIEANTPSLSKSKSLLGRYLTRTNEIIELDDIPPIIKSANGNIFWADEQCTRRVGPTATEARLFLKLLQTDEPEMLRYSDYKTMFDDFGREKVMLEGLCEKLPWWRAFRKKRIWKARIQWLEKIKEPRLWLLYLMARRRRILQEATVKILVKFKEKVLEKEAERIPVGQMGVTASMMGGDPTSVMGARYAWENKKHTNAENQLELQLFKKRLEVKFGAKSLHKILADYLTNSEQESLSHLAAHPAVDGSADAERVTSQPPREVIELTQLDGPKLLTKSPPTSPHISNETITVPGDAQSPPSRSRLSSIAHGLRSSVGSTSRSRAFSNSSDHTRVPGRCPVFNMEFEATRKDIKRQVELLLPKPMLYLVIGWFHRSDSDPKEQCLQFERPEELFERLREGANGVRGWRRVVSLKTLKGFGLYRCAIDRGAHLPLVLSTAQKVILSQFFLAYRASYNHHDDAVATAWQAWVQRNLNDDKDNPLEGKYSLQLMYDWSSYRLTLIVAVPVLLSLVLGLWYMSGDHGDVGAAWTIAGYIISAAALLAALIAILGSLKDN